MVEGEGLVGVLTEGGILGAGGGLEEYFDEGFFVGEFTIFVGDFVSDET